MCLIVTQIIQSLQVFFFSNHLTGTKFDAPEPESLKVTGWFNNQPYHIPPAALSYIYNAIFKAFIDPRSSYTISNHPLPFTEETKVRKKVKR